jgi:RNA polymerase sigma-70 factor (ECF subfamily)
VSPETTADEFLRHRTRLLGVAYRLLGSMWDAEDVVSEAMVRWLRVDSTDVREPLAYLTTMVTRLALDQLKSAHATRQSYVGPWLPEPTLTKTAELGPLDTVELRDSVSLATLHVMEQLTPPERGVFVLREAFELSFAEIGEILETTEAAARQLLHRARARIARGEPRFEADPSEHAVLLGRFLRAVEAGDLADLEQLLASDAISYSDGGGKVRAAIRPIVGRDNVLKFLRGLVRRFAVHDVQMVEANGLPAALLAIGHQRELLTLEVFDHRIRAVYNVLNPEKLTHVERQLRRYGDEVITTVS